MYVLYVCQDLHVYVHISLKYTYVPYESVVRHFVNEVRAAVHLLVCIAVAVALCAAGRHAIAVRATHKDYIEQYIWRAMEENLYYKCDMVDLTLRS